jgi:hypothetical protein
LHETIGFLAAVAAAFMLAGFVKGVVGMGLPTVAIGLLGLMVTPVQAAAIMVVPSFATNVWQGLAGGELRALLRLLWPLLIGVCIGIGVGTMILPHGDGARATIWLGTVLAAYAVLGLFKVEFVVPPRGRGWVGFAAGIATGIISVATGVFTVPGVPYLQALRLKSDALVQGLGLYFTVATVALAGALYYLGEFNPSLAWPAAVALGAALLGMPLGQLVRRGITPETFRLWFFIGLLLLGLHLALRDLL